MAIKRILVTGSNGYIGAVLTEKLSKKNISVSGIDTGFFNDCYLSKQLRNFPLIKKDIRLIKNSDLKRIDCIIHLAALSNDSLGELKRNLTKEINHNATIQLAKKAKKAGVKRFIFSSSCSVYGISKKTVTEKSKTHPLTTYAKNKVLSEKELKKLADKNFCVVILRNATVYGYSPQFRDDLVVNNLLSSAIINNEIRVFSDGTPYRPLIDFSKFHFCW